MLRSFLPAARHSRAHPPPPLPPVLLPTRAWSLPAASAPLAHSVVGAGRVAFATPLRHGLHLLATPDIRDAHTPYRHVPAVVPPECHRPVDRSVSDTDLHGTSNGQRPRASAPASR